LGSAYGGDDSLVNTVLPDDLVVAILSERLLVSRELLSFASSLKE
jgi:hypothetical protein